MNILKKFILIGFISFLVGCDNQLLLSHLSQRQSNEVLAILQEHGVEATRKQDNKNGDSIRVQPNDFVIAVDLLRQYNLPSKEPIEIIQAFPGDSLVASPQAERTRLLSLIEQRLEQSLLTIPDIINARVHVSYPLNGNNPTKQIQNVSSLVTYSGSEDPQMMMHKIKLFLTNSFAEANYDNVSVVVVNRPPLQYQIKSEPEYTFNPIIISSIIAAIIILFAILLLLWRQLSNKKPATHLMEKPVDGNAD
ncbi:type III secretion system inner membrane ring lipoprotein SctJ [Providencia rettgeri]|uniref:Lipoprotein n=1 Tax=Providencia rettgeri TaxID=587 RepID=A0AAJ4NJU9_PRORE|nr:MULTISPECIES: type III secretion inner membrane ring lipoprotein SctJ [Providencia]MDB9567976.1 type III secretion inner membrane ring lipoprotein SctJ [Providencia rettgeri]QWQ17122.1 type III secretion inner membrane ring lipoprotein SctJ [Providencia rettgeri]QWQ20957.1 type III secretion inner membrane ring lipoprotein SctJ [Providencia rettgeri]QWQ24793.1 type III secretion inner membrane ring lipoprotein SctJ [Providencia rettgeri]WOB91151.1 type III secretion inner membrane ring lipo